MWRKHQREQIEGISGVVRMPRGMFVFVCVDWQTDRLLCQVSEVFDKVSKPSDQQAADFTCGSDNDAVRCTEKPRFKVISTSAQRMLPKACWTCNYSDVFKNISLHLSCPVWEQDKHVYHGSAVRSSYYEWKGPPTLALRQLLRATGRIPGS